MALTTLARVKAYLGETGTSVDSFLTQLVGDVSASFERETGRTFAAASHTDERHLGNGVGAAIVLRHRPVTALTEIRFADAEIVPSDEYTLLNADSGVVVRHDTTGAEFAWAVNRFLVDYSSGFATIPLDLQLAADKQVAHEWQLAPVGKGRLGERGSILDAGGSAQYLTGPWAQGVRPILEKYSDPAVF